MPFFFARWLVLAALLASWMIFPYAQEAANPEQPNVPETVQPEQPNIPETTQPEQPIAFDPQALVEKLASDKKEDVEAAILSLTQNKDAAFSAILAGLKNVNPQVRVQCLQLLEQYTEQTSEIGAMLKQLLTEESETSVLRRIMAVVSKYNKDVIPELTNLLDHPVSTIRSEAIWSLAILNDPDLSEKLVQRFAQEPILDVKKAILDALSRSQNLEKIEAALRIATKEKVDKEEILIAQCNCAVALKNEFGQKFLVEIGTKAESANVRKYALTNLLSQISENNIGMLLSFLWDNNLEVRTLAYQKLSEITLETYDYDPKANVLDRAIAISKWQKWWTAKLLIAEFVTVDAVKQAELTPKIIDQGEVAVFSILGIYANTNEATQQALIRILGYFPIIDSIEHLIAVSKNLDKTGLVALETLAKINTRKNTPEIRTVLKEAFAKLADSDKIWLAAYLVAEKDAQSLEFLKAQLNDANNSLLVLNVLVAQKLNHPELNTILASNLTSQNKDIQAISFELLVSFQEWNSLLANFTNFNENQKIILIAKIQEQSKENIEKLIPFLATEKAENIQIKLCQILVDEPKAQQELLKLVSNEIPEAALKIVIPSLKKQKAITAVQLLDSFAKQKNPASQAYLLQAIAIEDLENNVGKLQEIVKSNVSEEVITEAIKQLLKVEKQDVASLVLEILPQQKNASLRLAWLMLVKAQIKENHLEVLEKILQAETENSVRSMIVSLFGTFSYDKVLKSLQNILANDTNLLLRKEALTQLVQFKKEETVDYLISLTTSTDSAWRQVLYENIATFSAEKALPLFQKAIALETPDLAVLPAFAKKFNKELKAAIPELLKKLTTAESKKTALDILSSILEQKEVESLLKLLPEKEPTLAQNIAKILDKITGITSNFNIEQQEVAIQLWQDWLKKWQNSEQLLKTILSGDEKQLIDAQNALLALGNVGLKAATQAFATAENAAQKVILLKTLARFNDDAATAVLRFATSDGNVEVRHTAYQSLINLQDVPFMTMASFHFIREVDPNIRITIFSSLNKEQQALHQNQLKNLIQFVAPDTLLKIVMSLVDNLPLSTRRELLFSIISTAKDDGLVLKYALEKLQPIFYLQDISVLVDIIKKSNNQDVITKALEVLRQTNYISTEILATKDSFVEWLDKNTTLIDSLTNAGKWLESYLYSPAAISLRAQKNLLRITGDTKKTIVGILLSQIKTSEITTQVKLVRLLGQLGNLEQAQPILVELLSSENSEVRLLSVEALYNLGWDAKSEIVQKSSAHQDPSVRLFVVKTIARSHDPKEAIPDTLIKSLNDTDSRVREEALFWLSRLNFSNAETVQKLLSDANPNVREQAIRLASQLKMTDVIGSLINDLNSPFVKVRQASYEALLNLSGQNFPFDPTQERAKQVENQLKWQFWWQLHQVQQQIQELAQKFTAEDIDHAKLRERLVVMFQESKTTELQNAMTEKILSLLKDKEPQIRTEIANFLSDLGNRNMAKELGNLLLDDTLSVRQATWNAIEKLTNTKLELKPIDYGQDEKAKEEWTKSVREWLPKWSAAEAKLHIDSDLKLLEESTQSLQTIQQISTPQEANALQKTIAYLKSEYPEVRAEAFKYVSKFNKDESFRNNGTIEDRNQDIEHIEKWLEKLQSEVEAQAKELPEKLEKIAKLEGDLNTIEGCENMRNIVEKMINDSTSHPSIQEKYLEIFKQKGLPINDYKISDDTKTKEDILYRLDEKIVIFEDKLRQAALDAEKISVDLKDAFALQTIEKDADIQAAAQLVAVLNHLHYPLRQKAIEALKKLAANDFGYNPAAIETERLAAIEKWNKWIQDAKAELGNRRQAYLDHIKKTSEKLTKVLTRDEWNDAGLLVGALQETDVKTREIAFNSLSPIAQNTFGYQPNLEPNGQKESLEKWQNWLTQKGSSLLKREQMLQCAQNVKNSEKATTSQTVAEIGILVNFLLSEELVDRQVAFEALSQYARNYAQSEIREDFGYAADAPENIRLETALHWQKWFQEKVFPIGVDQERRLNEVKSNEKKLVESKLLSLQSITLVESLVNALKDEATPVQEAALAALKNISKKNYQDNSNWKIWLNKQKKDIIRSISLRKNNIETLIKNTPAFTHIDHESEAQKILTYFNDPEAEIANMSLQWFQKQTAQKLENQANVVEWIRTHKSELILNDSIASINNGLQSEANFSTFRKVMTYLDDANIEIANKAFSILRELTQKDITWTETLDNKNIIKEKLNLWLDAQDQKNKLIAFMGNLTEVKAKEDLVKLRKLIGEVESPNVYIRLFAVNLLNQIAQKNFAYKADDPESKRNQDMKEIDQWFKDLEANLNK